MNGQVEDGGGQEVGDNSDSFGPSSSPSASGVTFISVVGGCAVPFAAAAGDIPSHPVPCRSFLRTPQKWVKVGYPPEVLTGHHLESQNSDFNESILPEMPEPTLPLYSTGGARTITTDRS